MGIEDIVYLKKSYEDKAQQLSELERKFVTMKREKEILENYCDKLIHFVKQRLPCETIPSWSSSKMQLSCD